MILSFLWWGGAHDLQCAWEFPMEVGTPLEVGPPLEVGEEGLGRLVDVAGGPVVEWPLEVGKVVLGWLAGPMG